MNEIIITDPKRRGTLEHNNELIIFMCKLNSDQDIVLADGFNLYIDGELGKKDIAEQIFNNNI
jgi:hypothetical protein